MAAASQQQSQAGYKVLLCERRAPALATQKPLEAHVCLVAGACLSTSACLRLFQRLRKHFPELKSLSKPNAVMCAHNHRHSGGLRETAAQIRHQATQYKANKMKLFFLFELSRRLCFVDWADDSDYSPHSSQS